MISIKLAEHELLPPVRSAPADTLIVVDGFSCREQISQATNRRALHLAEVVLSAMREGGPLDVARFSVNARRGRVPAALIGGAVVAAAALAWGITRHRG